MRKKVPRSFDARMRVCPTTPSFGWNINALIIPNTATRANQKIKKSKTCAPFAILLSVFCEAIIFLFNAISSPLVKSITGILNVEFKCWHANQTIARPIALPRPTRSMIFERSLRYDHTPPVTSSLISAKRSRKKNICSERRREVSRRERERL